MNGNGIPLGAMKVGGYRGVADRSCERQAMPLTKVGSVWRVRLLVILLAVFSWLSACAGGEPTRRRSGPPTRAQPVHNKAVMSSGIFEENAFSLLSGPKPPPPPLEHRLPPPEDAPPFDRDDLMQRLSRATAVIEDIVSAPSKPIRSGSRAAEAIDELMAVSRELAHDDPDYSSDVHYVRYAYELSAAARLLRSSLDRAEGPQAGMALRSVRAACASCHGKFNP